LTQPAYAELHAHSNFSFLDGASHPEEMAARAAELGLTALAITDHDGVYGAVRFSHAAREHGLHPIVGMEASLSGGHHLTLLARDREGYANICRLATAAHRDRPKGTAELDLDTRRGGGWGQITGVRSSPPMKWGGCLTASPRRSATRCALPRCATST